MEGGKRQKQTKKIRIFGDFVRYTIANKELKTEIKEYQTGVAPETFRRGQLF